jgi:UDP-glucose 4-epimerase
MTARTILVTGGAGHVGSHVIEQLVADPANRVISLDNYSTGREANHIAGAEYVRGHTRDIDSLIAETPEIVYHLGEYARISTSERDVSTVFDFNMVGTFAVVEFCRLRGVGKLVYAASSTKFAIEGDGRNQSPYGFTKAANVDLINNYGRWFGLPYAICYFYNGFGPRERGDGDYATLIAKFEQLYLQGAPLTVVRPGTQRRNFTYVGDLARGIIMAGEKGSGDGYALASHTSHSVLEIAEAFGGRVELVDGSPGRAGAAEPSSRARTELGWETTVDVMEYIREFVAANPR